MWNQYGGRSCGRGKCKKFAAVALCLYILTSFYTTYIIFLEREEPKMFLKAVTFTNSAPTNLPPMPNMDVEVWGKAAIGLYLWKHVLEGSLERRMGGVWSYGEKQIGKIRFRFRIGPGVVPGRVPEDTKNLVLVINGREPTKISFAKMWLDSLYDLHNLKNVAVVLLGNEQCNNDWLMPHMQKHGGLIRVAFVVYDVPYQSGFIQWPLGVATYRNFPVIPSLAVQVDNIRTYKCNFLGTIYPGSSRETLKRIINKYHLNKVCLVKLRENWFSSESPRTAQEYRDALHNSDLTLCPVGINTECYRIYEAVSFGSVPVIEDVMTPGNCGMQSEGKPLHILKSMNAPFIYIKTWDQLPGILKKEAKLSHKDIVERRRNVIKWYKTFKVKLKTLFVSTLAKQFVA